MRHHAQLFVKFLVETGFFHVGEVGLELLTSGDPPALASQSTRITDVSHSPQAESTVFSLTNALLIPEGLAGQKI